MTLYSPYLQHDDEAIVQQAANSLDAAAMAGLRAAKQYLETETMDLTNGDIAPFVLPWMYQAAARFVQRGSMEEVVVLEDALRGLESKWKAAGTAPG